jgi:hypothetical protein
LGLWVDNGPTCSQGAVAQIFHRQGSLTKPEWRAEMVVIAAL